MRDCCALSGNLCGADLGGCSFKENAFVEAFGLRYSVSRRAGNRERGGHLAGEPRQVLLHSLKFANRALECDALISVGDA